MSPIHTSRKLKPLKETPNKLVWADTVDGIQFRLLIPKRRVPKPWPAEITVQISESEDAIVSQKRLKRSDAESNPGSRLTPILAEVRWYQHTTERERYRPIASEAEREIGEPYIPFRLLDDRCPETLYIEVFWGNTSRWT